MTKRTKPNSPQRTASDPTPEQIWGPGGLAEQERMKRPEKQEPARQVKLIMLPFGRGKLMGCE
jgi:hypothetical protein